MTVWRSSSEVGHGTFGLLFYAAGSTTRICTLGCARGESTPTTSRHIGVESLPDVRDVQAHIVSAMEALLEKHGDSQPGVGWPRGDAETRYRVMLDVVRPQPTPVQLLDFGCGLSHLYDYIRRKGLVHIDYAGLDISPRFLEISRRKNPDVTYYDTNILDDESSPLPRFDYVIMNGIFTYKGALSWDEMFAYTCEMLPRAFAIARQGVAFNVMSKQVDWEREDLFHLPTDALLDFLSRKVSRHIVIRHDYGLYEYTTYVYRLPSEANQAHAKQVVDGLE